MEPQQRTIRKRKMATSLKENVEEKQSRPDTKRRHVMMIAGAVIFVGALVWGGKQWLYSKSHVSTDDASVDGHIVPVVAKVGGYVASVTVGENEHVTAGQVLVQLDTAELAVKLAQSEADLAAAEAAAGGNGVVGQAEAQVQTAAGQRAALQAQISAARANATRARADLQRMQELAAKQIISLQQLDAARAAAAADAAVSAAERQAAAAGGTVSSAQAGNRLAQARLDAARAARDNAKLQLSYAKLTAPSGGSVSRKIVEIGQLVQPAQQLMAIVADSGTWVTANFKETQLSKMKIGQPVEIAVDAYDGCDVVGHVESISSATGSRFSLLPPDNATGNFTKVVQRVPVRISIDKTCGSSRPLRPGMSAVAHVKTS
jgi:membrane fusion protein (multidrug efflux system)